MRPWLQKSASIQPRTSLLKFRSSLARWLLSFESRELRELRSIHHLVWRNWIRLQYFSTNVWPTSVARKIILLLLFLGCEDVLCQMHRLSLTLWSTCKERDGSAVHERFMIEWYLMMKLSLNDCFIIIFIDFSINPMSSHLNLRQFAIDRLQREFRTFRFWIRIPWLI